MKSTERGYKTVIEKTDKRTGKVTSYEGDVFVSPKTGKVTHTITEFVDGKKKGKAKSQFINGKVKLFLLKKTFARMLLMFFMKNQMQWVLLDFMSG